MQLLKDKLDAITLGMSDVANGVSMIQMSDVCVEISG